MKGIFRFLLLIVLLAGAYSAWCIFGPTVKAPDSKHFYIRTGTGFEKVKQDLLDKAVISNGFFFSLLSRQLKYDQRVRPGRYEIRGGNLLSLVRMLKAGRQDPVRLVINKLRTREDLAGKIGQNFEVDSADVLRFLNNNDSLHRYMLDTNTAMTIIIPNTYLFYWNSSVKNIFDRFADQKKNFWEGERTRKAAAMQLTPNQVYCIASIVEEETNQPADKGKVASTYINRLQKGMKLEADPTVKFAMKNFGLKRILFGHLQYPSPYNTYRQAGLPPGPICTPSINTIDAVLNAPKTDYIFFVAKPDLDGYSNFAATYAEHMVNAKAYQRALDSLTLAKNQKQ